MGILQRIMINSKIFFQQIYRKKLKLDEEITRKRGWGRILKTLEDIDKIFIPRKTKIKIKTKIKMIPQS